MFAAAEIKILSSKSRYTFNRWSISKKTFILSLFGENPSGIKGVQFSISISNDEIVKHISLFCPENYFSVYSMKFQSVLSSMIWKKILNWKIMIIW